MSIHFTLVLLWYSANKPLDCYFCEYFIFSLLLELIIQLFLFCTHRFYSPLVVNRKITFEGLISSTHYSQLNFHVGSSIFIVFEGNKMILKIFQVLVI